MKKSTKKLIMALAIILIFGLSSIAFIATGILGQPLQDQIKPFESNIVDGPISIATENAYIQGQFTFLRFHYKEKDILYNYTEQLPDIMATPGGEKQLVVNRLAANKTQVEIINLNGNFEVLDITQQGLFDALCERVLYTPTDCLLANVTQSGNATQ